MVINKTLGELPEFWDRSVVFFANLLSLFYGNETETEVLRKEVGALETYGSRLFPIINLLFRNTNNLLVLDKYPDTTLFKYFQDDLGLSLPQIEVVPHVLYTSIGKIQNEYASEVSVIIQRLKKHPAEWLDGYVTDDILDQLSALINKKTIGSQSGSRHGNNKLLLNQYLCDVGLPIFDTHFATSINEIGHCLKELERKGYHSAVIKAPIGASGIGMQKIDLNQVDGSLDIPEYLFYEGPCLVQGWLDDSVQGVQYIGSPSVQVFVCEDSLNLYDITEQILSHESVHEGNVSPPVYLEGDAATKDEILRQAEMAGSWLHTQGYRGTGSIDLHLIEREGKREVRICEINARVTGATYPAILARHFLPQDAWLMRNIRFDPPTQSTTLLKALDDHGLLFRLDKTEGVLPFNFNPDGEGNIIKGQFLFLGSTQDDVQNLLQKMKSIPSIKGAYDRD